MFHKTIFTQKTKLQYKPFKPQFKKLTPLERLKKTNAYFKRRLIRLSKKAGWLKRKQKRLKKNTKLRRHSICLVKNNKQHKVVVWVKKTKMAAYKSYKTFTPLNPVTYALNNLKHQCIIGFKAVGNKYSYFQALK